MIGAFPVYPELSLEYLQDVNIAQTQPSTLKHSSGIADRLMAGRSGWDFVTASADVQRAGGSAGDRAHSDRASFAFTASVSRVLDLLDNVRITGAMNIEMRWLQSARGFDHLTRRLSDAGINLEGMPQTPDNAVRLAIVARLFDVDIAPAGDVRSISARGALPNWQLARVKEFIERHISGRLLLPELAAAAGLSRMYFASQFRRATGLRPHDYVLQRRIARAQQLMASTNESLAEIAFNVGFQTQAHFTTAFKKIAGTSPARWRRDCRPAA